MGKKVKKPAPPAVEELRRPYEAAARRRAWAVGLLFGLATVVLLVVGAVFDRTVLLVTGGLVGLVGAFVVSAILDRGKLAACRALLEHEHWEAAVIGLKELQRDSCDVAAYLVALAYDRQGARKLALESYKAYLERHARGVWAIEARVRVEELEAAQQVALKAERSTGELQCPFCKAAIVADSPVAECSGCGTPYHAGCYEEQGGCGVYGCESKSARARVRS